MSDILLKEKKILIVDDEPDILETLEQLLDMCEVTKAGNFEKAKELLDTRHFDLAVLDIMGVNGYELLKIANTQMVPAIILTANALSPEDTRRSYRRGAAFYIPKDKMADIASYITDVLKAMGEQSDPWDSWHERFGYYYDKQFGPDWKKEDSEFWNSLGKKK